LRLEGFGFREWGSNRLGFRLRRAAPHTRSRNVKRFRGGLVFKAHRWLYHSTLGSRVIKKKRRCGVPTALASACDARLPTLPEEGSYLRLIDSCITQLKAQGPSRTCNESKEEAKEGVWGPNRLGFRLRRAAPHTRSHCHPSRARVSRARRARPRARLGTTQARLGTVQAVVGAVFVRGGGGRAGGERGEGLRLPLQLLLRYRGTSLIRKRTPLGPYRRPMSRVLGGWVFSYERGTPVRFRC